MECSCEIDLDYCDFDDLGSIELLIDVDDHKSSRFQICDECKEEIPPFDPHKYVMTFWPECLNKDLRIDRYRVCSTCREMTGVFYRYSYYSGQAWQLLKEYIMDGLIDVTESCLARLGTKNRERVCEMVEEMWEREGIA